MKKMLLTLLVCSTVLLQAEKPADMLYDGDTSALLVDKDTFFVDVTDEVKGGCLPKPKQLKVSMESALKKHGFTVAKKNNYMTPKIRISTLGFRINGMCVVDFTVTIAFPIIAEVPNAQNVPSGNRTLVYYNYYVGRHLFNYKRRRMQKTLNKYVKKYGDDIYMSIAKSKDKMFTKFPSIKEEIKKKKEKEKSEEK